MTSKDLEIELTTLLTTAYSEYLDLTLKRIPNEKIYAFCAYCANGCTSFGAAISTKESLERKLNSIEQHDLNKDYFFSKSYFELNACEWEYINEDFEVFEKVNLRIDEIYDIFYDEELEDIDLDSLSENELTSFINNFFENIIVNTFIHLNKEMKFSNSQFINDPLIGLQIPDPSSENEIELIKSVSQKLNSTFWNDKVFKNYELM